METVWAPAVYSLIDIIYIHAGTGKKYRVGPCDYLVVVTGQFYGHHPVVSLLVVAGSQ